MAVSYGVIGMTFDGEWKPEVEYKAGRSVSYDGSSYVVHTDPPIGTLPTDTNYWQVSAQGASKATPTSLGVVKPDGDTLEVDGEGMLSVKKATQEVAGIVKGSPGIKVGDDGGLDVNTMFEQATELANIIAGEAVAEVLGKISKSIAITMNLDQNALLKNMLTNIDVNDANKIPTSAYIHKLVERIGMGTELVSGGNLTAAFNTLYSDIGSKATFKYYGANKNLNIDFENMHGVMYLLITRNEIISVMRWSSHVTAGKIVTSDLGTATITSTGFVLNVSSASDIYISLLSLS